jgi:hypothetical protein
MAALFIDLTGSHHARTIIPKMNGVNKIATFLRTILFGPFRAFEKKQWKNKPNLALQFLSSSRSKFERIKSNLNAKNLPLQSLGSSNKIDQSGWENRLPILKKIESSWLKNKEDEREF